MKFQIILFSLAYAHMNMVVPPPSFIKPSEAGSPASSGCTLFTGDPGGTLATVKKFESTNGNRPLREFAADCYKQSGKGQVCGNTNIDNPVEITSGKVEILVSADHAGPSAIYLDDEEIHKNSGIERNTIRSHDFGSKLSCKKKNGCVLRFLQVSLQANAPEIYDNCVKIKGTGSGSGSDSSEKASSTKKQRFELNCVPGEICKFELVSEGSSAEKISQGLMLTLLVMFNIIWTKLI